jgi:hypothetical protein
MVRKMMFFKKREEESLEDFFERTNGSIKRILSLHRFRTWDQTAHFEVHKWAGCLARIVLTDPHRYSYCVFAYKDWNWIQNTIARQNRGRQLHGRYLRTWRWERPLYNFYGQNWQDRALDKDLWSTDANSFIEYRLANR